MGFFKNFILKQTLKSKLKNVPEAQRKVLESLIEDHPEFFQKIGEEVERRVKNGESEMAATMAVMREHQGEFQKLLK